MKYNKQQLIKKYHDKYIEIYGTYEDDQWMFEVIKVSNIIKENCNLPEIAIMDYK